MPLVRIDLGKGHPRVSTSCCMMSCDRGRTRLGQPDLHLTRRFGRSAFAPSAIALLEALAPHVTTGRRQVESVTSGKGGTYHRFERSGKPEYGQIGS